MDKLKMQTQDLADQNFRKLAELFPNAVTETVDENGMVVRAIDKDVLTQEINTAVVEGRDERYQFTWPDKRKAVIAANAPSTCTLRPLPDESVDFWNTQNLYIEGDNLEVLKLLQENYLGKVKMIYIDPPYNTGNDFVYKDDFAESTSEYLANSGQYDEEGNRLVQNLDSNGRFHTDWLNMIYPRLRVARNLLTEDGVIFISIDDNEVENLKKICNEVFGEQNFVGQWNWFKSATPPNLSYKIKKNIEYILAYEKNRDNIKYSGLKKESSSNDPFTKPQNSIKTLTFRPNSITTKLPDGVYPKGIYGTDKFPNELLNDLIIENGKNKNEVSFSNKFIWVQDTLKDNLDKGLRVDLSKSLVLSYKRQEYSPECPPNFIDKNVCVDTTEQAGDDLDALMGIEPIFDYPKPVSLLSYLLKFKDDKKSIILDFFSGSATTAHAVMQLNAEAEDGGKRKFIMVQLPEETAEDSEARKAGYKNICEIGKERIRRAGKKIKADSPLTTQDLDIGFRVLRLDSSNMEQVYYTPEETVSRGLFDQIDNIKPDRNGLDLLFQVMLELGVPLSAKIETTQVADKTLYTVEGNYIMACFDTGLTDAVISDIAQRKPYYFVMRDAGMADDSVAVNFEQLFKSYSPETILKVL